MYLLSHRLSRHLYRTVTAITRATVSDIGGAGGGLGCRYHPRHTCLPSLVPKRCLRLSSVPVMMSMTDKNNGKPVATDKSFNKQTDDTINASTKVTNDYNKVLTFPNILCMTRIVFTPIIGYLVIDQHFTTALTLCAIGSVTDLLDGYYARKFNCVTKLGALLDPLADKLLVATLTVTLTVVHLIPIWLTLLILTRDTLIITGALYLMNRRLRPPKTWRRFLQMSTEMSTVKFVPTLVSKINTGFQFSLVAITLAAPVFSYTDHWALTCLQLATGATTLASGLNYLKRLRPSAQ